MKIKSSKGKLLPFLWDLSLPAFQMMCDRTREWMKLAHVKNKRFSFSQSLINVIFVTLKITFFIQETIFFHFPLCTQRKC